MHNHFKTDRFPGAPRILFIGDVHGSHAISWINLLKGQKLNIRGFGTMNGHPPDSFEIPVYSPRPRLKSSPWHRPLMTDNWHVFNLLKTWNDIHENVLIRRALIKVVRTWKPDIVHTLGVFPASEFYHACLKDVPVAERPAWVVQARGGPDIEINRVLETQSRVLTRILSTCDHFIADTDDNYDAAIELGLAPKKRASMGRVPGTGGIDIDGLAAKNLTPASKRERLVLWPKAYEHVQSKGLVVLESLRLCWDKIQPCRFVLTAANDDIIPWIEALPPHIRAAIEFHDRLPREQLIDMMAQARIVLAPSVMDGLPNTMFESMAIGAVPILSPIPTIRRYVRDPEHAFFARNLYPHEIADALVRALDEKTDLDGMAERNLKLVREIADVKTFQPRIIAFYADIIAGRSGYRA